MSEPPISRGFRARPRPDVDRARVPPGQSLTSDFPVLSAGPTPQPDLAAWRFGLDLDDSPIAQWNWAEFNALPQAEVTVDIHCVTTWSKLDTRWRGVAIDTLLEAAGVAAPPPFVMAHCEGGYTTNVSTTDLVGGRAMIATLYDGKPLDPEHGGPARLLVPHLYFWKSAKWIRRLQFTEQEAPGFWEQLGYHIYGDPWREQRYDGD